MSKTVVQTKKQQQQQPQQQQSQILHLRSGKDAENQQNAVLETEDVDDTEEFYVGVFTKMKNIIDELDDRNNVAIKKVTAYQRAMDVREQEHRKKEQHLNDAVKDKESQIKLMNQEVEYYRTKDNASKNTRKSVTDMVTQLYDIKENKNKKKVEEGVDDLVDEILKKYRS